MAQAAVAGMIAAVGHAAEAEAEVAPHQVATTVDWLLGALLMVQPAEILMLRSRAVTARMAARLAAASGEEQVIHGLHSPVRFSDRYLWCSMPRYTILAFWLQTI